MTFDVLKAMSVPTCKRIIFKAFFDDLPLTCKFGRRRMSVSMTPRHRLPVWREYPWKRQLLHFSVLLVRA